MNFLKKQAFIRHLMRDLYITDMGQIVEAYVEFIADPAFIYDAGYINSWIQ